MIQYGRINKFTKNTLPLFINKKKQFLNKTKNEFRRKFKQRAFWRKKNN